MSYPHPIRLRGPWEFHPLTRYVDGPDSSVISVTSELPPQGRVELPADWESTLGRGFHGRVLLRRRFGLPSQLDPHERIWLLVDLPGPEAEVRLNGHALDSPRGVELYHQFEVTGLLQGRNQLELVTSSGGENTRPEEGAFFRQPLRFPEVRLEVRSTHCIDRLGVEVCSNVSDRRDSGCHLRITGQVIGDAAEDVALVATLGGHELAYQDLGVNAPFSIAALADGIPNWADPEARRRPPQLEIKLIRGAVRLWERSYPVLQRRVEWTLAQTSLTIDGQSFPLSAAVTLSAIPPSPDRLLVAAHVLLDDDYRRYDELGLKLIQCVPPKWAGELVPRLAHHPSIVAWTAVDDSPSRAIDSAAPPPGCRPWIPWVWIADCGSGQTRPTAIAFPNPQFAIRNSQ